jgi:hypothetical protein
MKFTCNKFQGNNLWIYTLQHPYCKHNLSLYNIVGLFVVLKSGVEKRFKNSYFIYTGAKIYWDCVFDWNFNPSYNTRHLSL